MLFCQIGSEGVWQANGLLEDEANGRRSPSRDAEGRMRREKVGIPRSSRSVELRTRLQVLGEAYGTLRRLRRRVDR